MHSLADEFAHCTDVSFKIVYIAEAHASDVWPISSAPYASDGQPVDVRAPTTTRERQAVAAEFVRQYNVRLPLVVDGIADEFEQAMSPWPIRFYAVEDGRLAFLAQPNGCSYSLSGLREWLIARQS